LTNDPSVDVSGAQALSGNSCLNDYDFRYRGVLRILHGFPLSSGASGYSTPRSNDQRRPNSSRSHRRPDDSYLKTAAFDAACSQLVVRRQLEHVFAISSSSFKDQRKLALQVCGMEWELPVDVVCSECVFLFFLRIPSDLMLVTVSRNLETTKRLRNMHSFRDNLKRV
jgi:hypothetical protein